MLINSADIFTWPTTFSCVLVLGDMILPNDYNLTISMLPTNPQHDSTMLGLKKVKLFLSKFLQNATIIHQDHALLFPLTSFSTNLVVVPHAPCDYFVASLLFRKLEKITEDYFTIHNITVDSSIGDRVNYQVTESCVAYDNILNEDNWWNQDNTRTNTFGIFPTWDDLDVAASSRFSPVLLNGGKNDKRSIRKCNP